MYPKYKNIYDFRGITNSMRMSEPKFMNVIKPKSNLLSKISVGGSLKGINTLIDGTQKVIKAYNEVTPIIKKSKPMIDNIRTTLKVARVFKRMNGSKSLEDAFDNLPDYEQQKKDEAIKTTVNKIDDKVPSPFYSS